MEVAGLDLPGESHGPADVLGEDPRGKAIDRIVGQRDGLVDGLERRDRHGRAEELVARDPHVARHVGHHGRRVDRADAGPPGHEPSPLAHGLVHPLLDPDGFGLLYHRPHLRGDIELAAGGQSLHHGRQHAQKVRVDPAVRQHALGGDADLPRIRVTRGGHGRGHLVQVGVRHHDYRAVGTQLHGDLLDARHPADVLAHLAAAGKSDLANPAVGHQRIANLAARAGQALNALGRKAGLDQDLRQLEPRQWRVRSGLDDHRVAPGDGRADLVAQQVEREVERADGHHDAAGHA